ncbi:MAG TPA: hypothetical protein VI583_12630 [Cyclobacteriaceae bacterium]|nr:hypothetical protein [Cyclobacteriaceae bacterium]
MMAGCTVYSTHKMPLADAIDQGQVRVVTADNNSYQFNNLVVDSTGVFGAKKIRNSVEYYQVSEDIQYVQLKDKTASSILSVLVFTGTGFGVFGLLIMATFTFDPY